MHKYIFFLTGGSITIPERKENWFPFLTSKVAMNVSGKDEVFLTFAVRINMVILE